MKMPPLARLNQRRESGASISTLYDRYWAQSCRYEPQKVYRVGGTGL